MKKIVALVLCLALALSLCTVAFAANSTTGGTETSASVDATGYKVLDVTDNDKVDTVKAIIKSEKTNKVVVEGADTTTYYYADVYEIDFENGVTNVFFEVDKSAANYKLVKGNVTTWLYYDGTNVADFTMVTTIKADKYVEAESDPDCGEYDTNVYVSGTKAYAKGGNDWVVYNGKFVKATTTTTVASHPHDWTKLQITYDDLGDNNADKEPVSIKCDDCEKTFKMVDTLADHNGDASTFVTCNGYLTGWYIILTPDAAVAGGSSSTTVESAKTFDAGIALYAGMALASVAGSAVVIGKKKEF